jgi:hypothetical protein
MTAPTAIMLDHPQRGGIGLRAETKNLSWMRGCCCNRRTGAAE